MDIERPKLSILDHRIIGWYFPWMMKGGTPTSSPLEGKVRLMKQLGYDGVGTSWWDLVSFYQERGDLGQLKAVSRELQFPLSAYSLVAEGWAYAEGQARSNALALAKSSLDLAHAAGCVVPYLLGPFDSGDLRRAAAGFRELCQYANELGLTLALEFVGISPSIHNMYQAQEVIELAGAPPNSGIALDSYHFFAGGSTLKDLDAIPVSQILTVHLADGPADLSDPSLELDRQMPGEGKLPLVEFVQILHEKGYRGFYHVECIQGRDYASDLAQVAARALAATRSVVDQAVPAAKAARP
jgi:sugar phosphate isomerase/epimerase